MKLIMYGLLYGGMVLAFVGLIISVASRVANKDQKGKE